MKEDEPYTLEDETATELHTFVDKGSTLEMAEPERTDDDG